VAQKVPITAAARRKVAGIKKPPVREGIARAEARRIQQDPKASRIRSRWKR
jgi:hypothetical protein